MIATRIMKTFHITSCKHFQFIDWPDHFVPKNYGSLLHLYKNVVRLAGKGHIVVHCSAGIGRTGVFIGAFMIFELYTKNKLESIESGLKRLREQRFSAVQTLDQYCFLHLLLIELILIYDPKVDKKQVRDLKKKYIQIVKQSVEESESGTAEKKDTTTEVRVPPPPKVAPIPKTTKPISDAKQTPTKKEQIQKPKNSKAKKT
uniref:Uncharacterized protein n=1 Tax=Panagrolaimus sp. ES5 TaxID=591445 RepID=A0AC34F930_9BILA